MHKKERFDMSLSFSSSRFAVFGEWKMMKMSEIATIIKSQIFFPLFARLYHTIMISSSSGISLSLRVATSGT
jgi:hypothetical protein